MKGACYVANWVLLAIAVVCWGSWSVVQKLASNSMSPMLIQLTSAYVYSAIAPVMFLVMKARGDSFNWSTSGILWTTLSSLLATAAGCAYLFAIERMDVHKTIGFTSMYPILTFALCAVVLKEDVTLSKMAGIVLICSGTYLTTR